MVMSSVDDAGAMTVPCANACCDGVRAFSSSGVIGSLFKNFPNGEVANTPLGRRDDFITPRYIYTMARGMDICVHDIHSK